MMPLAGRILQLRILANILAFYVGPGKRDSSWKAPMKKFRERVGMWKDQPLGLFWDARVYNMFAISTLTYVAQLEDPPGLGAEGS